MRKLRNVFTAALFIAAAGPALADDAIAPLDGATKTAIQGVITRQLDAIGHDDGTAAEAFAADGIRQKFPDSTAFLAMVKAHYAALIRPKSTTFGETEPSPHGPLQKVTIVAADGTVWTAIYSFEKADGGWRITGCGLEKIPGQQDI